MSEKNLFLGLKRPFSTFSEAKKLINFAINFSETQNTVIFAIFKYTENIAFKSDQNFLRNNCSDSDFNQVFDYVHRTHFLTGQVRKKCVSCCGDWRT